MAELFHREYLYRLPLPLAQLYGRAYNAKDARGRHDNSFYLFEAFVKLAATPLAACYLAEIDAGTPRVAGLDRLLAQLALPSLGQWVQILRELARYFGTRPDSASHPLGHIWGQLSRAHRDKPALLSLYRRIRNGPDAEPASDQSCSLIQVLDAMVRYRNEVFGHGAGRSEAFYDTQMGPLLFPAADELLAEGLIDPLGPRGSRLLYLTQIRTLEDEQVEVAVRELVGVQTERSSPLTLTRPEAQGLSPNLIALLWPGRKLPLRLDPLLVYRESETSEEVLFLNRGRNNRQVEYLSYTTGRTERDAGTAASLAKLLSRVTGQAVSTQQLDDLAQQSLAESQSVEALFAPSVPSGQILGDYELLAEIGRGGMGVVYLARQLSLGRLVGLKMLPADLEGDEVTLARFRREMRALARCDHPNIVKVLSNGVMPDGRLYYAMEYVPGCDLEQVWRELSKESRTSGQSTAKLGDTTFAQAVLTASRRKREQTEKTRSGSATPTPSDSATSAPAPSPLPLPPLPELPSVAGDPGGYIRRVAALIRDAALALQAVHDQHVIHRDVKPANLMLTPDGSRVVLMDFGLAKGQTLELTASKAGGLLGTLRYAAPEQLAAASLKVGPAADVRGLGVVLWELLTCRRLFSEAEDEQSLTQWVLSRDIPKLRTIDSTFDADLDAIVAKATERDATERITSAGKLAEYLQLWLDGKQLPIRSPTAPELIWRWVRKHRTAVASTMAAAALMIVLAVIIRENFAQQKKATEAAGLVKQLIAADPAQVPGIITEIAGYRRWADPLLQQENSGAAADSRQKLRTSLALLPVDPGQVDFLYGRLLTAEPTEVPVIRDALFPYKNALIGKLWSVVKTPDKGKEATRLRAAVALAKFDSESEKWTECSPLVVNDLVREDPYFFGLWREPFRPVGNRLLKALADVFRDPQPQRSLERNLATSLLADYAADRPQVLADLLMDADEKQFAVIYPKLKEQGERGLPVLIGEIDKKLPAEMPSSDESREKLAKRQANTAVALLRLNQPAKVWPLLKHSPDPRLRSYLIHRLSPLGADPKAIIKQLDQESDLSIRRALILSLGEFGEQELSPDERKLLTMKLQDLYQTAADPGLHAAAEWLLRTWKQEGWLRQINEDWAKDKEQREKKFDGIKELVTKEKEKTPPQWYVNGQGQTMVVIPGPVEFMMGSPSTEANREKDESHHKVRIGRMFALAAKSVTFEQYRKFDPGYDVGNELYTRMPELPVVGTSWYQAAAYCNWLSKQEGIAEDQWCYLDEDGSATLDPEKVHKLREGYLGLTGYRLPTEAELEYATRADAITSRYYGETEDLLSKYAWYQTNSDQKTWPVGSKKPNDLGFFDVHGNVWCWCQDAFKTYPDVKDGEAADDKEDGLNIIATRSRVLRGGSFSSRASSVRSAYRSVNVPAYRGYSDGFRAARTSRLVPFTSLPPPP